MNEHQLLGCMTAPMSSYLKSVGLIRILSKNDSIVTAYWKNSYHLVARTSMSKDDMLQYLLEEYEPSPIISPWSYNKYKKTKKELEPLLEADKKRYQMYDKTIEKIDGVVFAEFKRIFGLNEVTKNDIDEKTKPSLFKICRNMLPDDYVLWLDTVFALEAEKPQYAPLLGSGANDGNFDLAENFAKCLRQVLRTDNREKSIKWLKSALFGDIVALSPIKTVGHNPDGSGGPNSGSGFEGKSLSNPWDYVMMMEGTMLFAGSVSKRLSHIRGKAMFPFAVGTSNVGYATASVNDTDEGQEPESKGELWLPVWTRPSTYTEMEQVFKEGRMQIGSRYAETGTEAARSMITLGTERGIDQFKRYGILKRKGKAYLFINSGTLQVEYKPAAGLLEELDRWHGGISKKTKKAASLARLLRNYDGTIMQFCTTRKTSDMQKVLALVGAIERHVSILGSDYMLLQSLSNRWLDECYDGSAEFRLAASIASILSFRGVGSIRTNLERAALEGNVWKPTKNPVSFVWKDDDALTRNMSRVLQRRGIDGQIKSLKTLPIEGAISAPIGDIVEFLNGRLDTKKIGNLILPISCMKMERYMNYPWKRSGLKSDEVEGVPEAYMVMKLVCPSLEKDNMGYDLSMLGMLSSGRINAAYEKAIYMLHSHGFSPLSYNGRTKRPQSTTVSNTVKKHLMASLLFPISSGTRNMILEAVTNQDRQTIL